MLELRGDIHEGGGQILRTALALSARTGKPFRLTRIRAGRREPGLKAQHLAAVHLARDLCRAEVEGDRLHSQELTFRPGPLQAGRLVARIGTAGSFTLLLQACFWALAAAPGECLLELHGGSDVQWSPPFDYLEHLTLPWYRELCSLETVELRRGFFPKGQGLWKFRVVPGGSARPLDLSAPATWAERAGRAVVSRDLQERRVGERLAERCGFPVEVEYTRASCPGAVLTVWATDGPARGRGESRGGRRQPAWGESRRGRRQPPSARVGATALSAKGKSAEQMADEALALLAERTARPEPVDEYLADQLVPLVALCGGRLLAQEISPHTLANVEVVHAFLGPRLAIRGREIASL